VRLRPVLARVFAGKLLAVQRCGTVDGAARERIVAPVLENHAQHGVLRVDRPLALAGVADWMGWTLGSGSGGCCAADAAGCATRSPAATAAIARKPLRVAQNHLDLGIAHEARRSHILTSFDPFP
jgi:hypothetical protein